MFELFGLRPSRSNRAQWALEELGVPYTFYQIDFSKGEQRSPGFLALNPAGKMPALRHGSRIITESGAICNYLGEHYPEKGLTPGSGTELRPVYDQWLLFVLTELEQPLWTQGKHRFVFPKERRVPEILDTTVWEFQQAASLLSTGLGDREFMVGDNLTMVDIFVAHTLRWGVNFRNELPFENLNAYLARMEARPAFARIAEKETLPLPN